MVEEPLLETADELREEELDEPTPPGFAPGDDELLLVVIPPCDEMKAAAVTTSTTVIAERAKDRFRAARAVLLWPTSNIKLLLWCRWKVSYKTGRTWSRTSGPGKMLRHQSPSLGIETVREAV